MRALVTGDAGFIGFHLARRLLESGHEVLGIDALTNYYDVNLKHARLSILETYPNFTHLTMNLVDTEEVEQAFTFFAPELVFHLAAQAGVRYSIEAPKAYLDANVRGTYSVLEAARQNPPSHLLFASTSSVYGGNKKLPFAESDRADAPVSLYAATKKSGENIAHSYSHLWNLPVTCFRFFTVYGPWGRPDMALFKFTKAILNDEPIDVYGEGRMMRDFTYVDDLVEGILRLAQMPPAVGSPAADADSLSPVAPFRTVNLGHGKPVGLLSFIEAIEDALGRSAVKRLLPFQPGEVIDTSSDPVLLNALIGNLPSTDIKIGVSRFIDWYLDHYADRDAPSQQARGSNANA